MLDVQKMRSLMIPMSMRELQELHHCAACDGYIERAEIIHQFICARLDNWAECGGHDDGDPCVSHCTFDDECRCDGCGG